MWLCILQSSRSSITCIQNGSTSLDSAEKTAYFFAFFGLIEISIEMLAGLIHRVFHFELFKIKYIHVFFNKWFELISKSVLKLNLML